MNKKISSGTAHGLPMDIKKKLLENSTALLAWESISPLSRNEWICWVMSVKRKETRDAHTARMILQLKEGKRRPCCWIGCVHRKDRPLNKTQKWILNKQAKKM